jgi:hypothetical protein
MKISIYNIAMAFTGLCLVQCSPADGNYTGSEYMPDMAHSIAYEPNVNNYYYYHSWGSTEEVAKMSAPRNPVSGTIARGSLPASGDQSMSSLLDGSKSNNAIHHTKNASVPYYYGNTEEERQRATKEITSNPVALSEKGMSEGKYLYTVILAMEVVISSETTVANILLSPLIF